MPARDPNSNSHRGTLRYRGDGAYSVAGGTEECDSALTRVLLPAAPRPDSEAVPLECAILSERENEAAPETQIELDLTSDDLSGCVVGAYDLGVRIGSGGMGSVFMARHRRLGRDVAIKFIGTDFLPSVDARQRFEQETRALGSLQHLHIVSALDAGLHRGIPYLVTEHIAGIDLLRLMRDHVRLPCGAAVELVRQAALGLAHSHRHGFVHRDIKPSNLMLDEHAQLKILDFGIARRADLTEGITATGALLGTVDYLAPEQAQDPRSVDGRADIYSLGCTLIFLISGFPPFDGEAYTSVAAKLKGHLLDEPDWLKRNDPTVPSPLRQIVRRMVSKSPRDRFDSADEVASALALFADREQLSAYAPSQSPANDAVQNASRCRPNLGGRPWYSRGGVPAIFLSAGFRRPICVAAALLLAAIGGRRLAPLHKPHDSSVQTQAPPTNEPAPGPVHGAADGAANDAAQPEAAANRSGELVKAGNMPAAVNRVTRQSDRVSNAAAVQLPLRSSHGEQPVLRGAMP